MTRTQQQIRAWEAANRNAESLLRECLSPRQWKEYLASGVISVVSELGNRYEVNQSTIRRLECDSQNEWKPIVSYCLEPAGLDVLPTPDILLARTLWLTLNEIEFLHTASARPIDQSIASKHAFSPLRRFATTLSLVISQLRLLLFWRSDRFLRPSNENRLDNTDTPGFSQHAARESNDYAG